MTKYYYDCATSAIYMAKHFGLEYYMDVIEGGKSNGAGRVAGKAVRYNLYPSYYANKDGLCTTKTRDGELMDSTQLSVKLNYSKDGRIYVKPESFNKVVPEISEYMPFIKAKEAL